MHAHRDTSVLRFTCVARRGVLRYNGVLNNCNMSGIGPLAMSMRYARDASFRQLFGDACATYQAAAQTEMGNVNIYDIYVDVCTGDTPVVHPITTHTTGTDDDPSSDTSAGGRIGYDPCIGNAVRCVLVCGGLGTPRGAGQLLTVACGAAGDSVLEPQGRAGRHSRQHDSELPLVRLLSPP